MILDSTKKIVAICLEAVTTPVDFFVAYDDSTSGSTSGQGTYNATQCDVVVAPSGGAIRRINYMSFNNADNVTHTITIKLDISGVQKFLFRAQLDIGWTLIYNSYEGWKIYDAIGNPRLGGGVQVYTGSLLHNSKVFQEASIVALTAMASGTTYFMYLGTCNKSSSSIDVMLRIALAAVGAITWAEVAIYKGVPSFNGNATLTRLGFADISAQVSALGLYKKNVALSQNAAIGDELWLAVGGVAATTQFQIRGCLADELQTGVFQTSANRPSTASNPLVTTIGGAAVVPGFASAFIN